MYELIFPVSLVIAVALIAWAASVLKADAISARGRDFDWAMYHHDEGIPSDVQCNKSHCRHCEWNNKYTRFPQRKMP